MRVGRKICVQHKHNSTKIVVMHRKSIKQTYPIWCLLALKQPANQLTKCATAIRARKKKKQKKNHNFSSAE